MPLRFSTTLRNNQLDQITALAGAGAKIQFWTSGTSASTPGDGIPSPLGSTPTTQVKLAEITCQSTFATAASAGVLTLKQDATNTYVATGSAIATGRCTWARITSSGGTFVMDMYVGTSGQDLNMSTVDFVTSATITVSTFTITAGNS